MRSSYAKEDVIFLLKDITGLVKPQSTEEREKLIQSGKHYCEMLPIEYVPSQQYLEVYQEALKNYAKPVAAAIGTLADKIVKTRGKHPVLVSLARAGSPIGILLKRYLQWKYEIDVPHYSISIIRGRGIDKNAMECLLERYEANSLLFVDGWIGKGTIQNTLKEALRDFPEVNPELAVVADPAGVTELCGTHEDLLIPSSCLNSTVSGLVSRTFLRDDVIYRFDFHGAVYYEELKDSDLSYEFIHAIESEFQQNSQTENKSLSCYGIDEVRELAEKFQVKDMNLIKPGIGETTRVLLRRVPWKVLVSKESAADPCLASIKQLAKEKGVPVEYYPLKNYKACGIIKELSDV